MGGRERQFSEETAREIDCAVRDILKLAFDTARTVLVRNRAALDTGARTLLERETLTAAELPQVEKQPARLPAASDTAVRGGRPD